MLARKPTDRDSDRSDLDMAITSKLRTWRFIVGQSRPWSLVTYIVNRIVGRDCQAGQVVREFVSGKKGLEVGGPSEIFSDKGLIPIYSRVAGIDNCQFSSETLWQGKVDVGSVAWAPAGTQFISEASSLASVSGATYDFLAASHVLEHLANPMKALREWTRTIRDGGIVLLVVPHRAATFDHRRPYTEFSHLLDDLKSDTSENDLTHVAEILSLHDFILDPGAGSRIEFAETARNNAKVRRLHHHVFSVELLVEIVDYLGLWIVHVEVQLPYHIILVVQKSVGLATPEIEHHNATFLAENAKWRLQSPFKDDRARVMR